MPRIYMLSLLTNILISVSLLVALLLSSLIMSMVQGNTSLQNSDWRNLPPVLLSWLAGTTFCAGIALGIARLASNVYAGFVTACIVPIISVVTYPNLLWLPGTQWIYGAHFFKGGPTL
ncbi:MAG: hypothetical protein OWR62_15310, partial [Sulfobacillus thermotolerans]|nr:hypothetical protein [Sulfobacillus thermotolerans]